jgi:N-acetylglucosaminyl-diphospho-decaprenol L-rhamnosyltransferase
VSENYRLCVVIINYATPDLTKACLESLNGELGEQDCAVVVDNNSPDKSGLPLKNWLEDQTFSFQTNCVLSEDNHGFSGGNNLGIRSTEAKYYLLLNSDTYVRPGAIAILLKTVEASDDNIGLITPRLEWPDEEAQISCFRYHSPISEFLFASGTDFFVKLFKNFHVPIDVEKTQTQPQWSSFACILIKKKVIEKIGLMDEHYFLYYEDVDYCRMAKNAGFLTLNNPEARVVHLRGGSSVVKKDTVSRKRLPSYLYASRSRYFYKHYGSLGLLAANVLWSLGASIDYLKSIVLRRDHSICEKQFLDIWQFFSKPNTKFRP